MHRSNWHTDRLLPPSVESVCVTVSAITSSNKAYHKTKVKRGGFQVIILTHSHSKERIDSQTFTSPQLRTVNTSTNQQLLYRNKFSMRGLLVFFLLFTNSVVEAAFQSLPLVPHHVQQRRRRRLLQVNSNSEEDANATTLARPRRSRLSSDRNLRPQQVGALYQGYGTHYVDLWCGSSSPQRQTGKFSTSRVSLTFICFAELTLFENTSHCRHGVRRDSLSLQWMSRSLRQGLSH